MFNHILAFDEPLVSSLRLETSAGRRVHLRLHVIVLFLYPPQKKSSRRLIAARGAVRVYPDGLAETEKWR